MSIFAIGDLHLPGGDKKPMDVFGARWERHFERICADWQSRVKPEDIVLIPGDISWAMQLGDALNDLREIAKLPGTILLLRGNHDYWWSSLSQLRACLPENMHAVQNDAFDAGECVFCGTRGWTIPLGPNAAAPAAHTQKSTVGRISGCAACASAGAVTAVCAGVTVMFPVGAAILPGTAKVILPLSVLALNRLNRLAGLGSENGHSSLIPSIAHSM